MHPGISKSCLANLIQSGVSGVNDVLWEAGAVFYVRTTMPQTGMHLETSSNIYGVTLNPYNLSLSAGGSSGGESAIVALRGSVLVCSEKNIVCQRH
jgi:Asp-tRNA(Asn)/Glu-tRNA(Gln) amidotransferase A subunit family amidase